MGYANLCNKAYGKQPKNKNIFLSFILCIQLISSLKIKFNVRIPIKYFHIRLINLYLVVHVNIFLLRNRGSN